MRDAAQCVLHNGSSWFIGKGERKYKNKRLQNQSVSARGSFGIHLSITAFGFGVFLVFWRGLRLIKYQLTFNIHVWLFLCFLLPEVLLQVEKVNRLHQITASRETKVKDHSVFDTHSKILSYKNSMEWLPPQLRYFKGVRLRRPLTSAVTFSLFH